MPPAASSVNGNDHAHAAAETRRVPTIVPLGHARSPILGVSQLSFAFSLLDILGSTARGMPNGQFSPGSSLLYPTGSRLDDSRVTRAHDSRDTFLSSFSPILLGNDNGVEISKSVRYPSDDRGTRYSPVNARLTSLPRSDHSTMMLVFFDSDTLEITVELTSTFLLFFSPSVRRECTEE